jgi:hypothetical protein
LHPYADGCRPDGRELIVFLIAGSPGFVIGAVLGAVTTRAAGSYDRAIKRGLIGSLILGAIGGLLYALMLSNAPSPQEDDMGTMGALVVGSLFLANTVSFFLGSVAGAALGGSLTPKGR